MLARLNRPIVAIIAVTALAGCLRFFHLQHPPEFVFDEVYYPKAACILVGWSDDVCHIDSGDEKYWRTNKWDVGSWVHPPLGKWQIAMGIKAFGMNPFGWRVTSALTGTLVVALTAILAQLLFGSALWTFVAARSSRSSYPNIVMSRMALLDVHLELWVLVGFVALVLDRRWLEGRQPPNPDPICWTSLHRSHPSSRRCGARGASPPARPSAPRPRSVGWRDGDPRGIRSATSGRARGGTAAIARGAARSGVRSRANPWHRAGVRAAAVRGLHVRVDPPGSITSAGAGTRGGRTSPPP